MTATTSKYAEMAEEMTYDSSAGDATFQSMGTFTENPILLIFDNQSNVAIEITNDITQTWRTFPAGEAIVLDLRANHGKAYEFSFKKGTEIFASSAAGTGNFSISYIYGRIFP